MDASKVPELTSVESPPRCSIQYQAVKDANQPIGRGGQAVVYEVHLDDDYQMDQIALKEPVVPGTLTQETTESFLEEASTWAMVDQREREKSRWAESDHIVGIVDTGDRLPWIAMEYMDGGSLADRLETEQEGLPLDEALWIGECLCRGIEVAHSYGVAHLDLKPANILFRDTGDGTWNIPKIADWGVARVLAEQTGTVENISVSYAAPEQFSPEEYGKPDTLTDIYQLGIVLYTLLVGEPPFTGPKLSVMHDVTTDGLPPAPSEHRSDLGESIDATVLTALQVEKTDRYDSIHGFRRAIEALRRNERLPRIVNTKVAEENQSGSGNEKDTQTASTDPKERTKIESETKALTDQKTSEPSTSTGQDFSESQAKQQSSSSTDEDPDPDSVSTLSEGDVIKLSFTARTVDNENLVDTTDPSVAEDAGVGDNRSFGPRIVPLGEEFLFPSVEDDIIGRSVGDSGRVVVPAGEALGEHDPDLVQTIDANRIPEDERESGSVVTLDGDQVYVEQIIGGRARVDFNHPLAGEDIEYKYEITSYLGDYSDIDLDYGGRIAETIGSALSACSAVQRELILETSFEGGAPFVQEVSPLRLPVADVHTVSGWTAITGTVKTGTVSDGDRVVIQPSGVEGTVKNITQHHEEISDASSGDDVSVVIQGIDEDAVQRGHVCGPADSPPAVAETFQARFIVLDHPSVVTAGYSPILHTHSAQAACTIDSIEKKIEAPSGEVVERNPELVESGESAVATLRPQKPFAIEPADKTPELGSFELRDMGETIGVGIVTDIEQT